MHNHVVRYLVKPILSCFSPLFGDGSMLDAHHCSEYVCINVSRYACKFFLLNTCHITNDIFVILYIYEDIGIDIDMGVYIINI